MIPITDWSAVNSNAFFAADSSMVEELGAYLDTIRSEKNSVGAKIFVQAVNMPIGLGEPIFSRLDADIASAMMSINATKGVEIGSGFMSVAQKGTEHGDEITSKGFKTNNAGGILGGISSGQNIEVNVAFKPTSSIPQDRQSIDRAGNEVEMKTTGRHDPCVAIRAVPIVEAMLALVLIDHVSERSCTEQRGYQECIPFQCDKYSFLAASQVLFCLLFFCWPIHTLLGTLSSISRI